MKDYSLGRGLNSLIPKKDYMKKEGESYDEPGKHDGVRKESIYFIETDKIKPNPYQPRREFDKTALLELAESIREHGILQPLVVTKIEHETPTGQTVEYQLIAGERRLKAAKIAGLPFVPVIVRKRESDQKNLELALIENVQREDLNAMERAHAFNKLAEAFGLTQQEVAQRIGKSRAAVANLVRLLQLPEEIQNGLRAGHISEGHARTILALGTPEEMMMLYRKIVLHKISVRDAEDHVKKTRIAQQPQTYTDPNLRDIISKLEELIGTKVNFSPKKEGGRLFIEFYSKDDLYRFLDKLNS